MLLEFQFRNFRSFAGETTLSLLASSDADLIETNTLTTGWPSLPRALTGAVIYGANASGKSNLVRALQYMQAVIVESPRLKPEQTFNVQPFRLSEETTGQPALFEATILLDEVRYQYGFEMTSERILAEWLLVYKTQRPQTWFDRRYDVKGDDDIYEFGSYFSGQKKVWQEATRHNALFLSTAIQLNNEQLLPLHRWFTERFVVFPNGANLTPDYTTTMIREEEGRSSVLSMLGAADTGIAGIKAVTRKFNRRAFRIDLATGEARVEDPLELDGFEPRFEHESPTIRAEFRWEDESQGTQKLFALAGPLLDIMRHGKLLVIDELDGSLHPLLLRQIVESFQNPEINQHGAQLIFTTHDTSLLDQRLLRRDQVWLIEKNVDQASILIPLAEFSPRKGEALERGYLTGRYGGLPILGSHLLKRSAANG